jgi:hypothetical protein
VTLQRLLLLLFKLKIGFTRWQWYYNKKEHTDNPPHSNETRHTKLHKKNKGYATRNEYNANTIATTIK